MKKEKSGKFFVIFSAVIAASALVYSVANAEPPVATDAQATSSPSPTDEDSANKEVNLHSLHLGEIGELPEYNLSSTSDPNARCKTSSLTQEKFLELLHTIIEHGDLTDKAFIEKMLQVKFRPKYNASNHIPEGGGYKANMPSDMPDAPITVWFDIGTVSLNEVSKSQLSSGVLFTDLNRVGAVFHNCQYLTRKQLDPKSEAIIHPYDTIREFDPKLKKAIIRKVKEYSADASWDLGKVAKNGSDIEVKYTIKTDGSDAIKNISITQRSEINLNPIRDERAGH